MHWRVHGIVGAIQREALGSKSAASSKDYTDESQSRLLGLPPQPTPLCRGVLLFFLLLICSPGSDNRPASSASDSLRCKSVRCHASADFVTKKLQSSGEKTRETALPRHSVLVIHHGKLPASSHLKFSHSRLLVVPLRFSLPGLSPHQPAVSMNIAPFVSSDGMVHATMVDWVVNHCRSGVGTPLRYRPDTAQPASHTSPASTEHQTGAHYTQADVGPRFVNKKSQGKACLTHSKNHSNLPSCMRETTACLRFHLWARSRERRKDIRSYMKGILFLSGHKLTTVYTCLCFLLPDELAVIGAVLSLSSGLETVVVPKRVHGCRKSVACSPNRSYTQ